MYLGDSGTVCLRAWEHVFYAMTGWIEAGGGGGRGWSYRVLTGSDALRL